ncbi:hypothetical protein [Flavobacterium sp.]|nr:hypothetical protein [Flavobacterium sp.]
MKSDKIKTEGFPSELFCRRLILVAIVSLIGLAFYAAYELYCINHPNS